MAFKLLVAGIDEALALLGEFANALAVSASAVTGKKSASKNKDLVKAFIATLRLYVSSLLDFNS